ncbi:bifunctional diguanylate cyclase/phosphodiesterase [Neptunomonas phycophila]|uniref:bifunctional diguanylate cyclase/phosphodiesterase n=1 Tax=Neptunomonas phycophila TaxID=1572645 RepID=UPI000948C71E|nr:EAL domain-containing protein [Neptunomonas phycophila]
MLTTLVGFRNRNPLTLRILISIVLASSVFAAVITGFHLYGKFREDMQTLDVRLRDAESTFLPSIVDAVWRVDKPLVVLNLNAIAQLPFVNYLVINSPDFESIGVGEKSDGPFQTLQRYQLSYQQGDETSTVGELIIQVDRHSIYENIGRDAVILLLLNAFKTLCVSLIILYLMDKMLFRYLRRLRNTASGITMERLSERFTLGRDPDLPVDELDDICQSLESMRIRIEQGVTELRITKAERERVYHAASEGETAVIIFNEYGVIRFYNHQFEGLLDKLTIRLPASLTDMYVIDEVLDSIDTQLSTRSLVNALMGENHAWHKELFLLPPDSPPCWFNLRCVSYLNTYDDEQQYILSIRDVTELKNAYVRQQELVEKDALTGLPSLAVGLDMLQTRLDTSVDHNAHLAVFIVSTNAYKAVQETFGLQYADLMLLQISEIIAHKAPPATLLMRSGESDFLCAFELRSAHARLVLEFLDRLNEAFNAPLYIHDEPVHIDHYGGVAISPNDGITSEDLLQHAMSALYKAKEARSDNRFYFYEPAMKQESVRRLYIAAHIRSGKCAEELEVYFQPILKAGSNQLIACEALARWDSPVLGVIPPTEFIFEAERLHAICQLGESILQRACIQAAKWLPLASKGFYMSVNISPLQVENRDFIKVVKNALAIAQLPPNALKLEVTERLLLNDDSYVEEKMQELKALGVRIAIDDFGSGYASLNYLCQYPFELLKIDQSFISKLLEDRSSRILVKMIIQMAHDLGLETVAEGIEDKQVQELLESMGCDYLQGYLYSVPLPAGDFESYLNQRL